MTCSYESLFGKLSLDITIAVTRPALSSWETVWQWSSTRGFIILLGLTQRMYRVLLFDIRLIKDSRWHLNFEVTRSFVASDRFFTMELLFESSAFDNVNRRLNWSRMNGFVLLRAHDNKSDGILSRLRSMNCLASYWEMQDRNMSQGCT